MKDKMLAILGSYSLEMRNTIGTNTGIRGKSLIDNASVSKKIEALKKKKEKQLQNSL